MQASACIGEREGIRWRTLSQLRHVVSIYPRTYLLNQRIVLAHA